MNTTASRIAVATVALAGGLFLTACGSSDDKPSATAVPAPVSGGASSATVDGKKLAEKFTTTCAKQGGLIALALNDPGNATYGELAVSATLSNESTVQAVGIAGSKGGANGLPYAVGYGQGAPGGSAKVTKDGNTFRVSGEGVGAPDLTNPTAPKSSKFEIVFACDKIVG